MVDKKFNTTASARNVDMTGQWENLFRTSREQYLPDHQPGMDGPLPQLNNEWLDQDERDLRNQGLQRLRDCQHQPPVISILRPQIQDDSQGEPEDNTVTDKSNDTSDSSVTSSNNDNKENQLNDDSDDDNIIDDNDIPDDPTPRMRHSGQNRKVNKQFYGDEWVNLVHWCKQAPSRVVPFFLQMDWTAQATSDEMRHFEAMLALGTNINDHSGFDVKDEGTLLNYLGLQIRTIDDGSIVMTQPGLTYRILEALGLLNAAPKETPGTSLLGNFSKEPGPSGTINYCSVVGLLIYLVGNTRPGCAFATHQCARFSHDPKLQHELALKRIGRYLKGTCDGGIIL